MNIDINTKMITLIVDPLKQSFAARMQNAAYQAADINLTYFYTETGSEHLKEIIDGIRFMPSFAGAAVTKPNKVEVMKYLDEADPLCEKMGACNTIVKQASGALKGYNTDGVGFYTSITKEAGIKVSENTFFCIGAGGAGRAICSVLAYHGAKKIYITDLYQKSAEDLVDDINNNFAPVAEFVDFGNFAKTDECAVIINASGVGMGKTAGESPYPKEQMDATKLYFDACYNPAKTQFLLNAEEAGARILNGLGMSLYQGVAQIELWSDKKAPIEAMKNELNDIIAGR
ncbi:MAG: shikimate dehydrogenase [Bacteroidia bacterium]|nr:shikimate dehydrogenase [Bacteroidia bacterium]